MNETLVPAAAARRDSAPRRGARCRALSASRGRSQQRTLLAAAALAFLAASGCQAPPALTEAAEEEPLIRRLTDWPGAENGPEFSPDGRWIAFDAVVEGQADIYSLHLASGEVRQLTATPEVDRQPTWSADGSRIAFDSVRDGTRGIWSLPAAGGEAEPVFVRPGLTALGPDYAVTGDLAFTVIEPDSSRTYGRVTPWVLAAGSAEARSVTSKGDEWWARWGPAGAWLYYYGGYEDPLEAVHVETGALRSISRGQHNGWRPAPSPDGRVAFVSSPAGSIWIRADADDATPIQLTRSIAGDDFPSFSPDGRSLVFSRDRGRSEIIAIDLATGRRRRIGSGRSPQPLADGAIAFLSEEADDSAVVVAGAGDGAAQEKLALPIRGIHRFAISPAGESIVVAASGGGPHVGWNLHLAAIGSAELRRLTDLPGSGADTPVWCSDEQIGYTSYLHDLPFRQVFILDIETGESRPLTDSPTSKRLLDCADQGTRITFRLVAGKSGLYTARRADGSTFLQERRELDAAEGSLSPDGARLAFIAAEKAGTDIYIREADGSIVRVTDDALVEAGVRWLGDGSGLVFSVRAPNRDLWLLAVPEASDAHQR